MIEPSLDKLLELVDSKYTLVVLAAKRARELVEQESPVTGSKAGKPVTVALKEIASGRISYERTKAGIK